LSGATPIGSSGVVYVRRAYANGRLKHTKTRLSTRAVPLQAKALEALDRLPASDNPILFPNMRGGRIDFRIFGRKHRRPAQSEAEKALRKVLDRLRPGGGRATITLAEFVDKYLEMHQAAPVTIAKLRWLLGKATAELGSKRLADLAPREVYAWRMTVPEGHRFEATQALRRSSRTHPPAAAPSRDPLSGTGTPKAADRRDPWPST
jgi:hypothetical protein